MLTYAAQIEEWRTRWQTDPAVTFRDIAQAVGCSGATVATHARAKQWAPAEGVAYRRRHLSAAKTTATRAAIERPKAVAGAKPPKGTAWTSAFSMTAPVSTRPFVPEPPTAHDEDEDQDES